VQEKASHLLAENQLVYGQLNQAHTRFEQAQQKLVQENKRLQEQLLAANQSSVTSESQSESKGKRGVEAAALREENARLQQQIGLLLEQNNSILEEFSNYSQLKEFNAELSAQNDIYQEDIQQLQEHSQHLEQQCAEYLEEVQRAKYHESAQTYSASLGADY